MSLTALIRKRAIGKPATAIPAISATQAGNVQASIARVATIAVASPQESQTVAPDPAAEARRQRVLAMLADNPALRLAVVCDGQGDPVPVAIAIRDKATCEVLIPAVHFDPFTLLDLVERHSGTVH